MFIRYLAFKKQKKKLHIDSSVLIDCLGLTNVNLVGHFVSSPGERGKKIEEIVEQMKEWDRKERGTGMKVKKQKKYKKHSPSTLTCYKDSRPCQIVSQYRLDVPVT